MDNVKDQETRSLRRAAVESGNTGLDTAPEIRLRELRSCCLSVLYGYMDQYGNEYNVHKVKLTAGQTLTDPNA